MNSCFRTIVSLKLLLLLFCSPSFSQENQVDNYGLTPISVYGSVGISGAWVTASGYIEAIIMTPSYVNPFLRVGLAASGGLAVGTHIALEGGILFGEGNSHFEILGGWHHGISEWYDFLPYGGSVGYRYQKPQGGFIFRAGIGYTEGISIGIGVRL